MNVFLEYVLLPLALAGMVWLIAWIVFKEPFRTRRRKRILAQPFPPEWESYLQQNVGLYNHLPEPLKKQVRDRVKVLLAEKTFEGAGGLVLTDEIKVTIAGHAAILLLNRPTSYYPRLQTILVYPGAYYANYRSRFGGNYAEERQVRLGESWGRGNVVLAWDHVKQASRDLHDGHNVVLHEFAHQLDQEDGASDGAPILDSSTSYVTWGRVLGLEYDKLRTDLRNNVESVMDYYGATDPAEFFAVATETFFEKPHAMRHKHPELYEALREYYRVDPETWY